MGNCCLDNKSFGYCLGKPKPIGREEEVIIAGRPSKKEIAEGLVTTEGYRLERRTVTTCKLNPERCGFYKTSKEMAGYEPKEEEAK